MEKYNRKVVCTNLLCNAKPYITDKKDIRRAVCPHCGNVGAMPFGTVLSTDEILRQIKNWNDKVLFREAFKHVNYDKLPRSIEQQTKTIHEKKIKKKTKPVRR